MKEEDFKRLSAGDLVRSVMEVEYVVVANYGTRVTAVRTADLTNPAEWTLIAKAHTERLDSLERAVYGPDPMEDI